MLALVCVAILACAALGSSAPPACAGTLFPLPASLTFGANTASLAPQTSFTWSSNLKDAILTAAFARYSAIIFAATSDSEEVCSSSCGVRGGTAWGRGRIARAHGGE